MNQVRKHNCEIPESADLMIYETVNKQDVVKLEVIEDEPPPYVNQNNTDITVIEITLDSANSGRFISGKASYK